MVIVGTACSDDDPTSVSANEAAAVLADQFELPDDTADCLTEAFRADAQARRAVGREAGPDDIGALNAAVDDCVPPDVLATSVSGLMARNYSPEGPVPAEQQRCLQDEILGLAREDQVLLITGPLNQQIALDAPANLAAGDIVRQLAQTCGLL
jgi:hypothetical protein